MVGLTLRIRRVKGGQEAEVRCVEDVPSGCLLAPLASTAASSWSPTLSLKIQ
jgi:hypothetical protein